MRYHLFDCLLCFSQLYFNYTNNMKHLISLWCKPKISNPFHFVGFNLVKIEIQILTPRGDETEKIFFCRKAKYPSLCLILNIFHHGIYPKNSRSTPKILPSKISGTFFLRRNTNSRTKWHTSTRFGTDPETFTAWSGRIWPYLRWFGVFNCSLLTGIKIWGHYWKNKWKCCRLVCSILLRLWSKNYSHLS